MYCLFAEYVESQHDFDALNLFISDHSDTESCYAIQEDAAKMTEIYDGLRQCAQSRRQIGKNK